MGSTLFGEQRGAGADTPSFDALGHAVIATDRKGLVTFWNRAAEQMYGWSAEEARGRPIYELTVPEAMQEFAAEIMRALEANQPWSGVFTVKRKDGSTFPALVTDTGLRDDSGQLVGIVGVSVSLVEVIAPFLRRSHEAMVITEARGVVRMVSPVLTALTGWPAKDLAGRVWWDLVHPDDLAEARAANTAAVAGQDMVPPVEHRLRRPDGSWLWVETSTTSLVDEPAVRGVLLTLRDIRDRRAWLAELTRRAVQDELTRLVNRAVFMEHLHTHVAGRHHTGAILYVDLDDFKEVNDQLGHLVGDQVLRGIADRLVASVRPEDVCGRLGGDEFAVLAPSLSEPQQAFALARRIRGAISRPMTVGDTSIRPAASIGVAMLTGIESADHAIFVADRNMYARKRRRAAAAGRRQTNGHVANEVDAPSAQLPHQRGGAP